MTRAAGPEDFVTAVFAELDPRGWVRIVNCGHPSPLRLTADSDLESMSPGVFSTPLGLHPDPHLSTFSARTGDRLLCYTDGLLEARDQAGRLFRLDEHTQALRAPSPQVAIDTLLDRLRHIPATALTTTSPCCWSSSPWTVVSRRGHPLTEHDH